MELKALKDFHSGWGRVRVGGTTEGMSLTEEQKQYLLDEYPDVFEESIAPAEELKEETSGDSAEDEKHEEEAAEELKVNTPEDALKIENQEDKLPKSRKK